MDAIFLNPPYLKGYSRYSRSPCVTRGGTIYYPLMEIIATAYLEKFGFKAKVLDAVVDNLSAYEVIKIINEINPQVVCVATSTPSFFNDLNIAENIKKKLPKIKVFLVGRHVSLVPYESAKFIKNIDGILIKEYYKGCKDILEGKEKRKVNGLVFKENENIILNKYEMLDLKEIPLISPIIKRDLNPKKYFYASLRYPYIMLQHSFSCPFSCTFCEEIFRGLIRHRPNEMTIEEIRYIKKELPFIKDCLFDDPTFWYKTKNNEIEDLLNEMISNNLNFTWSCNLRCDVPLEVLKLMKKAGCRLCHVGIESLTKKGKDSVNKRITLRQEKEFLENCKKVGIKVHGCFIIGIPGETNEDIKMTLEKAKKLPLDTIQAFPLIPVPGTVDYVRLKKNGWLITEDYSKWLKENGKYNCVVSYPWLSKEQIEAWIERYYKEFYFRPKYIVYKIKQSMNFAELQRNFMAFKSFSKLFLSIPTTRTKYFSN